MRTPSSYDYAIVRVVPRVEREEFINAGVILSCPAQDFLGARIELDERRLLALDATIDLEAVRANLASIPLVCAGGPAAGPIGKLSPRERFTGWSRRAAPIIQTSAVHSGRCQDPAAALDHLVRTMVQARA